MLYKKVTFSVMYIVINTQWIKNKPVPKINIHTELSWDKNVIEGNKIRSLTIGMLAK